MEKTLNIKLDENSNNIINLDEVLEALKNISNDLNSIEYLESLLNYLEFQDIKNKDSLIDAIKSKLLEFKSVAQEELNSKEALEQARKYNEDLKRINVISTNKYDNDSKKDIEYITITHDDGSVEVLVCASSTSIGKYIAEHANDVATKSADEIFKYFKETVHNDLRFYKEEEFEELNPDLANSALVREEDMKALEVEEVRKYAQKMNLDENVQVTVDPNGERIYIVQDAIIKFHSDYSGNRVMDVLQEPKLTKANNNQYDELLGELDAVEHDDIFQNYATESPAIDSAAPIYSEEFDSIDFERVFPGFDINRLKSLLIQRDVYGEDLNAEDLAYITQSIVFLIGSMMERAENGALYSDEEQTLEDYMADIVNKYNAIESGTMDADELSETDKALASEYIENMDKIKALGLRNKPKMLEKKDNEKNSGVAIGLILVEIVVIALLVSLFLSIDI